MSLSIPEFSAESVSLVDAVRIGRFERKLDWLEKAVNGAVVRRVAQTRGIKISDQDLKPLIEAWRQQYRLSRPEDVTAWLAHCRLSLEDLELCLTEKALEQKLIELEILPQIEPFFKRNRLEYDQVCLGRLKVSSQALAQEVMAQIVDDGTDFAILARLYALTPDMGFNAGYVGWKYRAELSTEIATAVFGSEDGDIIGPFRQGDGWEIFKIHTIKRATLDEPTARLIQDRLWEEWIKAEILKQEVTAASTRHQPPAVPNNQVH